MDNDNEFKPNEEIKTIKTTETLLSNETIQPDEDLQLVGTGISPQSADAEQLSKESQPILKSESITEVSNMKPPKKPISKISLFILVVLLAASVAAGVTYWWRDKTANDFEKKQAANITSLEKSVAGLKEDLIAAGGSITDQTEACTPIAPSATVIESIKSSITSGNTAALEGYMAASVNVITAGSGAVVAASTPTAAVTSVTNFIDFTPSTNSSWNFALPAATLAKYSASDYAKYFPSIAVVGKSTSGKVISFSFDCNAKIKAVLMSPTEALVE